MSDSYVEVLVKKNTPLYYNVIKVGMIVLLIILFIMFLLFRNILFAGAGLVLFLLDNVAFVSMDLEFEYLYVNNSLQIDKIMSKKKRKQLLTVDMEKVEVVAPKKSYYLAEYNNKKCVEKDYTSGVNEEKVYSIICHKGKELWKVDFEPSKEMLESMRMNSPRKVFFDR